LTPLQMDMPCDLPAFVSRATMCLFQATLSFPVEVTLAAWIEMTVYSITGFLNDLVNLSPPQAYVGYVASARNKLLLD
jgi:hypothetical protein